LLAPGGEDELALTADSARVIVARGEGCRVAVRLQCLRYTAVGSICFRGGAALLGAEAKVRVMERSERPAKRAESERSGVASRRACSRLQGGDASSAYRLR
jgi:hypothetical protein